MDDEEEGVRLLVAKTTAFGESDQGRLICIEIVEHGGDTILLMIPATLEGEFFGRFQAASIMAAKVRGQDSDASVAHALSAEEVTLGVLDNQKIGLRLRMTNGMKMNMALTDKAIEDLRKSLADLDLYRKAGGPSSSH